MLSLVLAAVCAATPIHLSDLVAKARQKSPELGLVEAAESGAHERR